MWTFIIFLLFLGFADSIGGQTLVNIILILIFLLWAHSITYFHHGKYEKYISKGWLSAKRPWINKELVSKRLITLEGWGVIIILLIIISLS